MRISGKIWTRRTGALVVATCAIGFLGCPKDDPVDRVVAPGTGTEEAFNVVVTSGDGFGVPSGSIAHTAFRLAFAAPGETDVFGRATGDFPGFIPACCFFFAGFERNGSQDPRLPAIVDDDAFADGDLEDFDPEGWEAFGDPGDEVHDWFMVFANLAPDQVYVVGLVRYALDVRGDLDASQVLLGDVVDQPDSLFPIGGAPGGDATRRADLFNCTQCGFGGVGDPYPWEPTANPFIFGFAESDAQGSVTYDAVISACTEAGETGDEDACVSSAPVTYTGAADRLQNTSPVASNSFATFTFPNYNYLEVWEADFVRDAITGEVLPLSVSPRFDRPVVRVQMGVDLDPAGNPIPDSYAPFPTARLSSDQLANVQGVLHPAASSVIFSGLPPLTGDYGYKMWLMNLHVDPPTAAPAIASIVETTDAGAQPPDTSAVFNPQASTSSFAVSVSRSTAGVALSEYSHFVITYEADTGTAMPSPSRFMFHQYINRNATDTDFSDDRVSAGGLILGAPASNVDGFSRRWGLAGTGLAQYFGDEFRARVTQFARPPLGFFLDGWLVGRDTLGATFYRRIGPLTRDDPPTYTSLFDADTSRASGVVTETFVAEAISRIPSADALNIPPEALRVRSDGSTQHGYCAITEYWITLEPKDGRPASPTIPGPTVAAVGETPETLLRSPLCR